MPQLHFVAAMDKFGPATLGILAMVMLSGCAAPSPTVEGAPAGLDEVEAEVVLLERRFDLSVTGVATDAANIKIDGTNCVFVSGFAGTNVTSVHARVDPAFGPTSTQTNALKANLLDDRGIIGREETVGTGPLELELRLEGLWSDLQGDLYMKIRLWPHGDVGVAMAQDFVMDVSVYSTNPTDTAPEMHTMGCGG